MEHIKAGDNPAEQPVEEPEGIPSMPEPKFPEPINDPKPDTPFIPADQPDQKPEENY